MQTHNFGCVICVSLLHGLWLISRCFSRCSVSFHKGTVFPISLSLSLSLSRSTLSASISSSGGGSSTKRSPVQARTDSNKFITGYSNGTYFFLRLTFVPSAANVNWVVRSGWKVVLPYATGVIQLR